jgi:hypothetical protein
MPHALRRSTSSSERQPRPRFELLQVVFARQDVPEYGLRKGECGTIVEVFEDSRLGGDAYLVEFTDDEGRTLEEAELTADQIGAAPPPP